MFLQDPTKTILKSTRQHQVRQGNVWIAHKEQVRQISLWLKDDNWTAPTLESGAPTLCLVDELAQVLGELSVSEPSLVRSGLHRNGTKLPFITIKVTLQQCKKLSRLAHNLPVTILAVSASKAQFHNFRCVQSTIRRASVARSLLEQPGILTQNAQFRSCIFCLASQLCSY
jgi:hypothetical protein